MGFFCYQEVRPKRTGLKEKPDPVNRTTSLGGVRLIEARVVISETFMYLYIGKKLIIFANLLAS
jgi:hypothetical protein